jgi:hypothetical protein
MVSDALRIGTQGAWSVTRRSSFAHSFLVAAGSVCCAACAWLASWSAWGSQNSATLAVLAGSWSNEWQVRTGRKKSDAVGRSASQPARPSWILRLELWIAAWYWFWGTLRTVAWYPSCLSRSAR